SGVLLTGVYQSLNYWFNRKGAYRRLAANRVALATLMVTASIGLGLAGDLNGLLVGRLIRQSVTTIAFAWADWREDRQRIRAVSVTSLRQAASRYRRFAQYSILGDSVNALTGQMPVFLLATFFGQQVVGFYSQTQRVLAAPSS